MIEIPARCFTCEHGKNIGDREFSPEYGDPRCYDLSNYSPYTSMSSLSTNCPLDQQYCVTEVLENETQNSLKRYCSNEDKNFVHGATDEDSEFCHSSADKKICALSCNGHFNKNCNSANLNEPEIETKSNSKSSEKTKSVSKRILNRSSGTSPILVKYWSALLVTFIFLAC